MKNKIYLTLLVVLALITACNESDDPVINVESFEGDWRIYKAEYDEVPQSEWEGIVLTMRKTNYLGGTYELSETPYDSLWEAKGEWGWDERGNYIWLNNWFYLSGNISNNTLEIGRFLSKPIPGCDLNDPNTSFCPVTISKRFKFFLTRND